MLEADAFPLSWCEHCGADVLTYLVAGTAGERRACVNCDTRILAEPCWVDGDELRTRGYDFLQPGGCGAGGCAGCPRR